MKILGICGSLRLNSVNGFVLKAAQKLLSEHQWLEFDLSALPYFDADFQYSPDTPKLVLEFRKLAASADFIFVCTPEYAHGLPGLLKNALEWLFHEGTQGKPVYVVINSVQGENTQAQLIEILNTMDFKTSLAQTLIIKGARKKIDSDGNITDLQMRMDLSSFCGKLPR